MQRQDLEDQRSEICASPPLGDGCGCSGNFHWKSTVRRQRQTPTPPHLPRNAKRRRPRASCSPPPRATAPPTGTRRSVSYEQPGISLQRPGTRRIRATTYRFRLYVSLGGGVRRCWSITGIWARISSVIACQLEPGPNANGCGVDALKGVASSVMDLTCASSMSCTSRLGKCKGETAWDVPRFLGR